MSTSPAPAPFDTLKTKLRGPLHAPGESPYDESRSLWNGMIDRKPAMVVRPLGVADVVASVNFAREARMPICIKGGGHNIAGLAVCDDGLLLDMSLMRGVFVDPKKRIAHAQAGCLLGDVDRETQLYGLAAVMGFVSNTGIAGLTLGGGIGYVSRRFGWTSDNVRSMTVVTANGEIVRASEEENPDLFWGLRGGGGNFGVVIDFEYVLYPVGPEILGGAIAWPIERAPQILEAYRELAAVAPESTALVAATRLAPPAPWIAKEYHGKPIVAMFVCHTGDFEEGERIVAKIRALGAPVGDIVQRRPYITQQSLLDATQPKGRRYYWKSEYLKAVDRDLMNEVIEQSSFISPHSAIIVFPLGGAIANHDSAHSPVGNRDAAALLNITSAWDRPEDDAANIEWTRRVWNKLRRFSTGGTYINFLTEEDGEDRIRAAYGGNLARLGEIKKKWDPDNLFRANKNIAPQ
jgi:FAD/FMN-containing dehydrogenase